MIIIYINKNEFFKNVDITGNIFTVQDHSIFVDRGLTKIELDDTYKDCIFQDFNEDLTFSIEKYNARKNTEVSKQRIEELKELLKSYDYIGTKIATGRATKEEYATQISQMTEWAKEINDLEANL